MEIYPVIEVIPLTLRQANSYVKNNHRHHGVTQGYKFAIGLQDASGNLRGVAIVGRPVSRSLDDGQSAEVTRMCTDGYPNACSKLYSAAWKTAKSMGYKRLYTYTLDSETGISLKASGWSLDAKVTGRSWDTPVRPRSDKHPTCDKNRWVKAVASQITHEVVHINKGADNLTMGAKFTHVTRVSRTEIKVKLAIRKLKREEQKVSKTKVAELVGLSREQLSRRYQHLFS
jgi:hypothetical protein